MANLYYKLLVFTLGALGLSCGRNPANTVVEYGPSPEYGPVPMYGVPYATYELSGQVLKASDHAALQGIEVSFDDTTVTTDSDGNWSLELRTNTICGYGGYETCSLYVVDVDGAAGGGEFDSTQVALELIRVEDPDGVYNLGTFEQHAIAIALDSVSAK